MLFIKDANKKEFDASSKKTNFLNSVELISHLISAEKKMYSSISQMTESNLIVEQMLIVWKNIIY